MGGVIDVVTLSSDHIESRCEIDANFVVLATRERYEARQQNVDHPGELGAFTSRKRLSSIYFSFAKFVSPESEFVMLHILQGISKFSFLVLELGVIKSGFDVGGIR